MSRAFQSDEPSAAVVITMGLLGLVVVVGIAAAMDAASCEAKADKMGYDMDYGPVQGCMVHVDDRWLPIESVRVIP